MFEADLTRECSVNDYKHVKLGKCYMICSQTMAKRWASGKSEYPYLPIP
jgi:hypothetical protein